MPTVGRKSRRRWIRGKRRSRSTSSAVESRCAAMAIARLMAVKVLPSSGPGSAPPGCSSHAGAGAAAHACATGEIRARSRRRGRAAGSGLPAASCSLTLTVRMPSPWRRGGRDALAGPLRRAGASRTGSAAAPAGTAPSRSCRASSMARLIRSTMLRYSCGHSGARRGRGRRLASPEHEPARLLVVAHPRNDRERRHTEQAHDLPASADAGVDSLQQQQQCHRCAQRSQQADARKSPAGLAAPAPAAAAAARSA